MADESNNNIIVSRIQHRRGLKQDLPQPLRPGEIGVATDSRQVYIGGDPANPASQGFNSVSYFENTLGAQDHAVSIANNQIIAFQVPYIKFTRGEFDGITDTKTWSPDSARSILSSVTGTGAQSKCKYTSSDYPVFGNVCTADINHTLSETGSNSTILVSYDSNVHSDSTANIRIGDKVTHSAISSSNTVIVSDVSAVSGGNVTVSLSHVIDTTGDTNIAFTPQTAYNIFKFVTPSSAVTPSEMANIFSDAKFTSQDVVVRRNGVKLIAETDADSETPSSIADYVIDADNADSNGVHYLTLRTRPSASDDIALSYYSNANVAQAFIGVESGTGAGNVSAHVPVQSFYTAKNIPEYRQIPADNIRLSETTGLGYIGLDQKHLVSSQDGANIADPSAVTLGTLLLSRASDNDRLTANTSVNFVTDSSNNTVTFTLDDNQSDILANVAQGGVYSYAHVYVETPANTSLDVHETVLEVELVSGKEITCTYTGSEDEDFPATPDNVELYPVLGIDLSANTTVKAAIPTVNKESITINADSASPLTNQAVFPYMDFLPQTDGTKNAVYITSKPAFTSIGAYGATFRLHNDSANTVTQLGLTESTIDESDTVKAKLEEWMYDVMHNRDFNMFTNVFSGGELFANIAGQPTSNVLTDYNLVIDNTNGEIVFCDRQESEHFNHIVNNAYNESFVDRLRDEQDGVRGLVNLKNNLELQTREAAVVGQKITTYTSLESTVIGSDITFDEEVFRLGIDTYNTFSLEYSMVDVESEDAKYMRSGTILVTARLDTFADGNTAVIFRDNFNSMSEGVVGETLEPKFQANVIPAENVISFSFAEQNNPNGAGTMAHNLDTDLKIKYVIQRWSSTS